MSNFGPEYRTNANDRATRMQTKINALNAENKANALQALRTLQAQQIDQICGILEGAGIRDSRAEITTIDDVNNLFRNFGLSGGRKSRRRKSRKSMKSRRRRY